MQRLFGWLPAVVGVMSLFILSGCSSHKPLGDPGDAGRQTLCPEKADDDFSPCMESGRGERTGDAAGPWCSSHRGIEYVFDCEACRTRFDEDPDVYVRP